MSIGDEKPNFEFFLHPLVTQLKRLEYGIPIDINGCIRNRKFFLVSAVFDKPAKAAILNMKLCTGFFGCTKCLQPGESFRPNHDGYKYKYWISRLLEICN